MSLIYLNKTYRLFFLDNHLFRSDYSGIPDILTVTCGSQERPTGENVEDDTFVRSNTDIQNAIDQPPQVMHS